MNTGGDVLITCFLPHGKGHDAVKALHEEKGINGSNITTGRGLGTAGRVSFGRWAEFDILYVVTDRENEDDIFSFIYDRAEMDRPHGGLIFTHPLTMSTPFTLPVDIEEEPQG